MFQSQRLCAKTKAAVTRIEPLVSMTVCIAFGGIRQLLALFGVGQLIPFFKTWWAAEGDFLSIKVLHQRGINLFWLNLIAHDRANRVDECRSASRTGHFNSCLGATRDTQGT
jgi:hypothetical protein